MTVSVHGMRRAMLALALSPALVLGSVSGAGAQTVTLPAACGEHEAMVKKLASDYSESRKSVGLSGTGDVVELFASDAGTWSVVITNVSGVSCLIMSGENWEEYKSAGLTKPAV